MRVTETRLTWLWIFGVTGLLALLPLYYAADPSEGLFPACPFRELTGLFCTGCGSQRALHDLLHLNISGSFGHNMLFPPTILLLGWHFSSRFISLRFGKGAWKSPLDAAKTPLWILIVVSTFTLLRNLPWEPFTLLAP